MCRSFFSSSATAGMLQSRKMVSDMYQARLSKILSAFTLLAVMLLADQVTKLIALERFIIPVYIMPILDLRLMLNTGATFGFLSNMENANNLFICLSIGILIAVLVSMYRHKNHTVSTVLAYLMVLSGGTGNLMDRYMYGAVVDFIDFHIGRWHYPTFNIADSFIVIGAGLFILSAVREGKSEFEKTF